MLKTLLTFESIVLLLSAPCAALCVTSHMNDIEFEKWYHLVSIIALLSSISFFLTVTAIEVRSTKKISRYQVLRIAAAGVTMLLTLALNMWIFSAPMTAEKLRLSGYRNLLTWLAILPLSWVIATFFKAPVVQHDQRRLKSLKFCTEYGEISLSQVENDMNVLFVCLGNICRSPMAEGILKQIYQQRAIKGDVASVGLMDWNASKSADYRAIAIAKENGLDITSHRARQIRKEDFENYDLILAMDSHNIRLLENMAPEQHKHKVRLLLDTEDVRDPYQGNEDDFRTAFKLMKARIDKIAAEH